MSGISGWLRERGLEGYSDLFERERIDLDILPLLSEADLTALGVPLGDRKRIRKSLAESRAQSSADISVAIEKGAERRQATIIICDLVDSTSMAQTFDPEDMSRLNGLYQNVCKDAVERYGGHVLQYRGDAVIACFGYPVAYERDAERSVRAALEMVSGLKKIAFHTIVKGANALTMRIGIATGLTVVGALREGDPSHADAVGETPNLAARLQGLAQPDEIIISHLTRRLIGDRFQLKDLGPQVLKGFQLPVHAYQVLDLASPMLYEKSVSSRALAPLIGRDSVLIRSLAIWSDALGGHGRSLLLMGEPGIGKSRLVYEVQQAIRGDEPFRWLYYCSPYHDNSPLFPVIEQLARGFRFDHGDDDTVRRLKLQQGVRDVGAEEEAIVPYLSSLLGLPPDSDNEVENIDAKERKQRTYTALVDLIGATARKAPLLIVVEDLHWMDPSTRELLGYLLPRIESQRVFVVLTSRVEPSAELQNLISERVDLSALDPVGSERLIRSLDDARMLTTEAVSDIVSHTNGIPLFIEETTIMVLSDLLNEINAGRGRIARSARIATPATLNEMFMARLDRLGPARVIALMAAVIGRPFAAPLLARCTTLPIAAVEESLQKLTDNGTLHMRLDRSSPTYEFRHALLRDVAYRSLLKSTCRTMHQRVADALVATYPQISDLEPEVLAHHLTEAGAGERSFELWQRAGEIAVHRSANHEAVVHLRKALATLDAMPRTEASLDRRLAMLITLIAPLLAATGYGSPQLDEAIEEAIDLCREIGSTDRIFPILYGRWLFTQAIGRHRMALSLAQEYLELATQHSDVMPKLGAYRALAWSHFNLGEPLRADEYLTRARLAYDQQLHRQFALLYGTDHEIGIGCGMVQTFWVLGRVREAWQAGEAVLARARATNHGLSLFLAGQWGGCLLNALLGRWPEVTELAIEMERNGSKHTVHGAMIAGHFYRRLAEAFQSGSLEAQIDAGAAIDSAIGAGYMLMMPFWMIILADSYLLAGRPSEAEKWLNRAEQSITMTDDRWAEPELYRLRAELHAAMGQTEEAFKQLLHAMAIARECGAKSWELRVATSLAALARQNDGLRSSEVPLADIIADIDAPFEYADLRRARELLAASSLLDTERAS